MTTDTVPQEKPSRARTLLALVSMLDQLPAPEEIRFSDKYAGLLTIMLATATDWDAWVKHFTAYVYSNRERYESTVQCNASAVWLGWSVSLTVCTSNRGQERLTSEEAASVGGMYLPDDSSEAPSTAKHAAPADYFAEDPADDQTGGVA